MIKLGSRLILLTLVLTSCAVGDQPRQVSSASEQSQSDRVQEIYEVDHQIHLMEEKIAGLREAAYQANREDKFEKVHELKEKVKKSEQELKDIRNKLEKRLLAYKQNWQRQPWWRKIALESGPQYIRFDSNLHLDDAVGLRVKIHWIKQEFRPFHLGSYLYYPLESDLAYPLKQVEASRFIIEYRNIRSESDHLVPKRVKVDTYLIGFGLLGQSWSNTYIKINLLAGLERYSNTEPDDIGPVISYTLGFHQKVSQHLGIELDLAEEVAWSKANQRKTHTLFNFLAALVIRYSF